MKRIFFIILVLFGLNGCDTGGSAVFIERVPPDLIKMSDGEIVSYSFTYEGIKQSPSLHTITKISDGDPLGEIIYTIEGQSEERYRLDEKHTMNLNSEQMFLFFGGKLIPPTSSSPDEAILIAQENDTFTLVGQTLQVSKRIYREGDATITTYSNEDINDTYPLNGLIKYEWSDGTNSVTVELIEWNDL